MLARILRRPLVPSAVASSPVSRTRGIEEFFDSGKKIGEKVEAVGEHNREERAYRFLSARRRMHHCVCSHVSHALSPENSVHEAAWHRMYFCQLKSTGLQRLTGALDAAGEATVRLNIHKLNPNSTHHGGCHLFILEDRCPTQSGSGALYQCVCVDFMIIPLDFQYLIASQTVSCNAVVITIIINHTHTR